MSNRKLGYSLIVAATVAFGTSLAYANGLLPDITVHGTDVTVHQDDVANECLAESFFRSPAY